MVSNVQEVKARKGNIALASHQDPQFEASVDHIIRAETLECESSAQHHSPVYKSSYCVLRECNVISSNLAKSVTVDKLPRSQDQKTLSRMKKIIFLLSAVTAIQLAIL